MDSPKITKEEVVKVSKLAKMDVSGQEDRFADLFTDTLTKIQDLNEIDTNVTPETFQVTGLVNVFQKEDHTSDQLTQQEALANAKEVVKGCIATKGVFTKGEEDES